MTSKEKQKAVTQLCIDSTSRGCVGFEWLPDQDVYRLAFKEEHPDMFDLFFDAGFEILGESPLKGNEVEYPYRRYLVRWKTEQPSTD